MGALAQAAIVSEKLKALIPSAPSAYSRSVDDWPSGPPRPNPYRDARLRRMMRKQTTHTQSEVANLKDAVSDLLTAAMNIAAVSARIANGELKAPTASAADLVSANGRVDPPVLMAEPAEPAVEASAPDFKIDSHPSADLPSTHTDRTPEVLDTVKPATPTTFVRHQPDRETVAPGMVTLHGGMSIPRVAPFIFGVSNDPDPSQGDE